MKIAFVIDKLNFGGAEQQLLQLVKNLPNDRFKISVVVFHDGGNLQNQLDAITDVNAYTLHKRKPWDIFRTFHQLLSLMRYIRPDIINSYLGVTNELSLIVGRLLNIKVAWSIRVSDIDLSDFNWAARCSFLLSSRLSQYADLVILNSQAGLKHHVRNGYKNHNMIVIPNGIDTMRFRPEHERGNKLLSEWGLHVGIPVIGIIGRIHPMKDHLTFLHAAAEAIKEGENIQFVCVGNGEKGYEQELKSLSVSLRLSDKLLWLDSRYDMVAVYNALNILTSASAYGEGFSNTIGEAMACGVPCVVTDVGDSREIVGDCGIVVPPKDANAMKEGWKEILNLNSKDESALRIASRKRIIEKYPLEKMIHKTETAFFEIQ